jgi:uncharacterized membrane protein
MQSHAAWKRLTETFFLSPVVGCMPASKTVPTLMMSQNRLAGRDRLEAHNEWGRFHNLRGWPVVRRKNGL